MKKTVVMAAVLASAALGAFALVTIAYSPGGSASLVADCVVEDRDCIKMATLATESASASDAFASFESSMELDPALRQNCHRAAHRLGSSLWTKFEDDALVAGGGSCAFGVYHGILQQIAKTTPSDLQPKAEKLCALLATRSSAQGEECIHGIGHALALVVDDLDDAFDQCAALEGANASKCNQGATMEWVLRFRDELPKPSALCTDEILPSALGDCVNIAYGDELTRDRDNIVDASCDQFDTSVRPNCILAIGQAIGHWAALAGDQDPYFTHPFCSAERECVVSMVIAYVMNTGRTTAGGRPVCEQITLREACLQALDNARSLNRSLER